jgi:NAD+ synthase
MNQELLKEIITKDYSDITKKIEIFLKDQVANAKTNGVILGLSGGIDSAVITYLCARSFKEKTLALVMPDSKISPKEETEDALKIIEHFGIDYKLIDINLIVSEYSKYIEPNNRALGNLRARIRTNLLYYYANSKNLLVVGSSDKSEYMIGYFTKFGDGASDILPIVSLYKTQVRELARYLGVSEAIISKKSSPNLWAGHIAEEEIGVQYEEIDLILNCIIDKKLSTEDTVRITNIDKNTVDKINQLYKISEHKRITAAKFGKMG